MILFLELRPCWASSTYYPQSASDTPHTCSQHRPGASISLSVDEHWKCPKYQSEHNIWRFKAERDLRAKAKGELRKCYEDEHWKCKKYPSEQIIKALISKIGCNGLFWKIEIKVIKYQKPGVWIFIPIHITFFHPPPQALACSL